jgi:hypothetical protein
MSVCLCIPSIVSRQRLSKHVPTATITLNSITVGSGVSFVVHVVSNIQYAVKGARKQE